MDGCVTEVPLLCFEQVCNEVIDASGGVAWEDIAGLETAKHLIKEIVVWPMLNPQIFTVSRGVLLALCLLSRVRVSFMRSRCGLCSTHRTTQQAALCWLLGVCCG
jgi:hypothetical protein